MKHEAITVMSYESKLKQRWEIGEIKDGKQRSDQWRQGTAPSGFWFWSKRQIFLKGIFTGKMQNR
jgi:hypothetical protein